MRSDGRVGGGDGDGDGGKHGGDFTALRFRLQISIGEGAGLISRNYAEGRCDITLREEKYIRKIERGGGGREGKDGAACLNFAKA